MRYIETTGNPLGNRSGPLYWSEMDAVASYRQI